MRQQAFILFFCGLCIFIATGNEDNYRDSQQFRGKSQNSAHLLSQLRNTEYRTQPGSQSKEFVCQDGNRLCKYRCTGGGDDNQWDDEEDNSTPGTLYECPANSSLRHADFNQREIVYLGAPGDKQGVPKWVISRNGAEISQTQNSPPGVVVLNDSLSSVDFEGNVYVDTKDDDDYIGFVFSYQNRSSFYVVAWKKAVQSYLEKKLLIVAEQGLHIKLVNSKTGPGWPLTHALWHTYGITDQTKSLWYDDVKTVPWVQKKLYRWVLVHRPVIGLIRVKIFEGSKTIIDSGNIYDNTLLGGKLGVYADSQVWVKWSNMSYQCKDNVTDEIWQELPPKKRKILESVVNSRPNNCNA